MIPVAEIFGPTIQGEGPHVGMQTLFVRVAGCDFKCAWCDSKFAWKIDDSIIRYGTKELKKFADTFERHTSQLIVNEIFSRK